MSAPSTKPRPSSSKSAEPTFWKRWSARGECPISLVGSVLLHALALLAIVLAVVWRAGVDSENSKPPQMDVVEIEGGGGGLGGIGEGPGKLEFGKANRKEGAELAKDERPLPPDVKVADFKLKDIPKNDLILPPVTDLPHAKDADPFAALDRQQAYAKELLSKQIIDSTAKAGTKYGSGGAAGGPVGPGLGKGSGAGKGLSPTGSVLTDQRRRELRWKILASEDGDVHLKKLQALRVNLVIPLRSKPGYVVRYDLSKPGSQGQVVRAADDSNKVRWKNTDPKEMMALAKALRLPEIPQFSVIYLPSELEADMARRELDYQGRKEQDIQMTVWDVRERDGSFDNEPFIVEQLLRPGAK
jgi:hypothetical protein